MKTIRTRLLGIINVLLNHDVLYRLIGWLNARLGFLFTVFATYPINDELASQYLNSTGISDPWKLRLIGVMRQEGRWGIVFGVCATEQQFMQRDNKAHLQRLVDQLEHVRLLVNAQQKTFGGILPGLMLRHRLIREAVEADVTATTVYKAVNKILHDQHFDKNTPIIVIGARGFIGKRVVNLLNGYKVYPVDQSGFQEDSFPNELRSQPAVLLNISRQYALKGYIPKLWKEVVVLNEVYPEPSQEELSLMQQRSIKCFHVVGVEGSIFPPLPGAYASGVPCCAAIPSIASNVVVSQL
jgi:hypothetical protein